MGIVTVEISDLEKIVDTEIKKVLSIISINHNIDTKSLLNNWSFDLLLNYPDIIKESKEIKKRPINPNNFCMARKPDLKRCTRAKKKNCDYCPSHQFNLSHGRIDEEHKKEESTPTSQKSKINPDDKKKKIKKTTIKLKTIMISDKEYYIDNKNHLYITEKEKDQIKYRHIGNWNKSVQTIEFREN